MGEDGDERRLRGTPLGWLDRRRASREYEARFHDYLAALRDWESEVKRLDDALQVVDAGGIAPDPASRVRLRPGERLQYEIRDVQLLETRTRPVQTTTHHAEIGLRTPVTVGIGMSRAQGAVPTEDSTVLDVGRVIVTNRRVAFAGPKHAREWLFDELISLECSSAGTVYLPVTSRRETSGFRYRSELHWRVTSRLEIGLSLHGGDSSVVDGWRRRRARLDGERPRRPVAPSGVRVDVAALERAQENTRPSSSARPAANRSHGAPAWGLLGRRTVARLIDAVVVSVLFGYILLAFPNSSAGAAAATATMLFLYEVRPVRKRGRSFGKRVVGLVVVDIGSGRHPGTWRSMLRALVFGVLVATVVGALVELFRLLTGRVDRPIHDRMAGTRVVALS